jgi:DMSO/TMAO reductase YedYZ molybdopterin-dependent catalytic subunit
VPHWYAVASVKWLKRIDVITEPYAGEFQTGHYIYQWADKVHEPVRLMRSEPGSPIRHPAPSSTPAHIHGARKGLVRKRTRHPRRRQPVRRRPLVPGSARSTQRALPVAELVLRMERPRRWKAHAPSESHGPAGNVQPDVPPWNRLGYGNNAIEVQYVDVH